MARQKAMTRPSKKHGFVVCVRNAEYPVDLEVRKIYRTVPDRAAETHGLIRVIDDSGEDYLYPAKYFAPIKLPVPALRALKLNRPARAGTACPVAYSASYHTPGTSRYRTRCVYSSYPGNSARNVRSS
jgi:hypothetical protein